jgi:hypothetical protein
MLQHPTGSGKHLQLGSIDIDFYYIDVINTERLLVAVQRDGRAGAANVAVADEAAFNRHLGLGLVSVQFEITQDVITS